jgi:uncharacterized protein YndB with AHSA1/START domain
MIAAPPAQLWEVISDPHHLPRWWPRVHRVEDVSEGAFTEVMKTAKGKLVRADFELLRSDSERGSLTWSQRVEGTPFARVLRSAETEVALAATADGTKVTIELRQTLSGMLPKLGGFIVRRAALETLDEALNGLERISG